MAAEGRRVPEQLEQIINASRIPDPIKLIPPYTGDKKGLTAWLSIVDTTLALYEGLRDSLPYRVWVQQIRNKITGDALKALEGGHANITWPEIKQALSDYFGDKRELSTLTQNIPHLRQGKFNVHDYYNHCSNLYSAIENKIRLDPENAGHEAAIMRVIANQVKNGFIDGLREPYDQLIRNYKPDTLHEAYTAACEQIAAADRKNLWKRTPRAQTSQYDEQKPQNSNKYQHNNDNKNNQFRKPQNPPQQPFQQNPPRSSQFRNNEKWSPAPTPMEVDPSIRSRNSYRMNNQHLNAMSAQEISNDPPQEEGGDEYEQFSETDEGSFALSSQDLNFQLATTQQHQK